VRKSTLGKNVLGSGSVHSLILGKQTEEIPEVTPGDKPQTRERVTIYLPPDIIDKVKDIVYYTPGMTMADLAEQAFTDLIAKLENVRGEEFPKRPDRNLRAGRRPG
jgi:hypothetical protein